MAKIKIITKQNGKRAAFLIVDNKAYRITVKEYLMAEKNGQIHYGISKFPVEVA